MCINNGGGSKRVFLKTADTNLCGAGYKCFQRQKDEPESKPDPKPEDKPNGTFTGIDNRLAR